MLREKFTENSIYSQFFSFEVLDYFDSICTDENYEWIVKYFDVLMKKENEMAEKFNMHHIRPCCTFKDKNHKNRKQTLSIANNFNGNILKLSIYNHILAHYYLWKIFDNWDLRNAIKNMCSSTKQINKLTEIELIEIAKFKEEYSKESMTKEQIKEYGKKWRNENKETLAEKSKERYNKNKKHKKEYDKEYYKNHKEEILQNVKNNYENNKEHILEYHKEYSKKNKKHINEYVREHNSLMCYDPIAHNKCKLKALRTRKYRHKDKYQNINPSECIIKIEQDLN